MTGNLVAENERSLHDPYQLFPIPVSNVDVGVASTTGFYLDQNFIRCGTRPWNVLDRQLFFEIVQDSGFHSFALAPSKNPGGEIRREANHGFTPRKKNSMALSTRSVNL